MNVICSILIVINASNINWQVKADVEGLIIGSSSTNYVVDFNEGIKKYPATIDKDSYNKVIVPKNKCVKL